jgi:hypothetical protein
MNGMRRTGRVRIPGPEFVSVEYSDALDAIRSLGLAADLVENGPLGFAIHISESASPVLTLTDYWDPLPVTRAEQVGWMLCLAGGKVLSHSERPTAAAAAHLIEPALLNPHFHHQAA